MRVIKLGILAVLSFIPAFAQQHNQSPFLSTNITSDARSAALANAVVTLENELYALFFNPATIYMAEKNNIGVTFQKNISDINSGSLVYSNDKLTEQGIWAVSVSFTDFGTFERSDAAGFRDGSTFGGSNLNLGISYSDELDSNWYYGATLRYLYAGLESQSSSAAVADLGMVYEFSDMRSKIGMSLLNAGFVLNTFDGAEYSITPDFRIGFSHRLQGMPLLFNIALHHLANEYDSFFQRFGNVAVGGEFTFEEVVKLRAGYDFMVRSNLTPESQGALSGISFGLGLDFSDFDTSLSFNQYGSQAMIYRITLNMKI